ncbi:MAG: cob(I)yrinic acid a,c-diamide adenosyltransferase [Pseudomonadota bacterium]|nr:cob(I)yrinic acid a,c-diamide adenosyltransferase [Pseudomonadota bacterium]MDE3037062.1 cob(I)yrinic acid a,c-diamide adenosyltransferase [Pseudomonadota bacterium]
MVKLNTIYTRTGDDGTTGLVGGSRRAKHDLRIEACGTVDEANSMIGIARCHMRSKSAFDASLKRVQHDLFDLGADLATPPARDKKIGKNAPLRIVVSQVTRLEKEIDALNAKLSPLNSFVLPGGTDLAAALHLARAITRRAERVTCALAEKESVNPIAIQYLNRLSDFLFVLARVANSNGKKDVLWQPGVNR